MAQPRTKQPFLNTIQICVLAVQSGTVVVWIPPKLVVEIGQSA